MPTSPASPSPSSPSSAHSVLLRLNRRHSLPTSGLLSGFFRHGQGEHDTFTSAAAAANQSDTHTRSASVVVSAVADGVGNRHRYGHRHTRSEAYNQPIIVKNYNPAARVQMEDLGDAGDEDVQLPGIQDFSWGCILKAVDPQVNAALDGVNELCSKYQSTLRIEVDSLTEKQSQLQARIKDADKLAAQALKSTKMRSEQLEAETAGLKGGAAVDSLAEAAEATHTVMTSIVSTLLAIDEMLPPQDRLSPETSAHRNHFPKLHTLLVGKAAELNVCFGSGRAASNGKRPSTTDNDLGPTGNSNAGQSSESAIHKSRELPLRRRLSSSSQILLSSAGLERSRAPPPQLQLKTILPSPDLASPKVVDSAKGAYFPLAPQTATGISLAHSNGKSSSSSSAAPPRRSSGIWGPKPSTSTLAFFPIDEGEGMSNDTMTNLISRPPLSSTPGRSFSWRRSSGSWSGLGGLFGGRGEKGSGEGTRTERAEDRLKKVLESMETVGKGKKVVTGSW
jgi:hypothetical protein